MGPPASTSWWKPLEWHRRRRSQAVPTVTVLLGDPDVAEWLWTSWQSAFGTPVRSVAASSRHEILEHWLCDERVRGHFSRRFLAGMAARHAVSTEELVARLAARSPSQLLDLVERETAATLLPRPVVAAALQATSLRKVVHDDFPRALAAVADTLESDLPAILIRSIGLDPRRLAALASSISVIAEAIPQAELALALPDDTFSALESVASGRVLALIREGTLRIQPVSAGASNTAAVSESAIHYAPIEYARSEAERRLYRQLERRQRTRGLFELNHRLTQRFGTMPMEVDLICESLRVAVEVDGYYHFRDDQTYRRDRRKDLLLQELGYMVVRVLASDVMEDIDSVLAVIDKAVFHRTSEAGP